MCPQVRACPYGSCREVGHAVLLSGEAISLWMFLPLSEKYHRRNFLFYTVLRKLFLCASFSYHFPHLKTPFPQEGDSGTRILPSHFSDGKRETIWKYQCLTLPRKAQRGNHDDPHSHPEGSMSLLSALRAGLAGPQPSGGVRGCDVSYSTGSAG